MASGAAHTFPSTCRECISVKGRASRAAAHAALPPGSLRAHQLVAVRPCGSLPRCLGAAGRVRSVRSRPCPLRALRPGAASFRPVLRRRVQPRPAALALKGAAPPGLQGSASRRCARAVVARVSGRARTGRRQWPVMASAMETRSEEASGNSFRVEPTLAWLCCCDLEELRSDGLRSIANKNPIKTTTCEFPPEEHRRGHGCPLWVCIYFCA